MGLFQAIRIPITTSSTSPTAYLMYFHVLPSLSRECRIERKKESMDE
jgi:hypothetical protein